MFRRLIIAAAILAITGFAAFWVLTTARTLTAADLPDHQPDLANGEDMFWAGGCESCHAAPGAAGEDLFKLGGGEPLTTPFGIFYPSNISTHRQDGIGDWTLADFVNAMKFGVGADGRHLYPAFPYTSYQRMRIADIIDLKAFLDTLPAVAGLAPDHRLPFPFSIRRGLGAWKLLYVDGETLAPDPALDAATIRGAYLVEGPAHCGECHSPRNAIGGIDRSRLLGGGPAPEGTDMVPNITPHADAIGGWTDEDIVFALESGITPSFESLGAPMNAVQRNMARLDPADLAAIARYLKSVPEIAP